MDAELYDELSEVEDHHWWFQARRRIIWSLVERFAEGGMQRRLRICELGCGTGGNLTGIASQHDVMGVECSALALAYARKKLGNRVRQGSLPHEVDLPAASYDVVLLTDVLEHIEDDVRSAHTALGLLKPGGIVVATVPAYQWLYAPRDAQHRHFRRYSKEQFRGLWNVASANVELLSYYNTLLFGPAAAVRLATKLFGEESSASAGDLYVPARPMNRLLQHAMASESSLLGRVPLPFGMSLVAVVRKNASALGVGT